MKAEKGKTPNDRQVIAKLTLICRQALVFLQGKSSLDKARLTKKLRDAVDAADRHLAS